MIGKTVKRGLAQGRQAEQFVGTPSTWYWAGRVSQRQAGAMSGVKGKECVEENLLCIKLGQIYYRIWPSGQTQYLGLTVDSPCLQVASLLPALLFPFERTAA